MKIGFYLSAARFVFVYQVMHICYTEIETLSGVQHKAATEDDDRNLLQKGWKDHDR